MSLLSMPNEILVDFIFSDDNITVSDLFQLMLSCRRFYSVIVDSNRLWMCKFSARWPEKHNQLQEKESIIWKDWVFSLRIIKEVKASVTSLSSQCYPLGKPVAPVLPFEKWLENEYPIFLFDEDKLQHLIFNEEMKGDLTLSYYANVALKKLRTCLQVRNLNIFKAKSDLKKTFLEGAKLISKWFHFSGDEQTNELIDNVEPCLEKIVERVKQLVEERNSTALEDILKCIKKVLYGEMSFRVRVYNEYDTYKSHDWKHKAASIHWVLEERIGYPSVVCVIYLEVAAKMGITCEPICLECVDCSKKLMLKCRAEDNDVDIFCVNVRDGSFFDLSSIHPDLVDKPACSFEVFFGKMLETVIVRDLICPRIRSDLCMADLHSSVRLVCVFWPVQVNVLKYAQICLEANDQVDDAYQLLRSAEFDSNHPVMINCIQRLCSQQAVIDAAKVARPRLPSIVFAVGLIMAPVYKDIPAAMRNVLFVIISWDESFHEEVSREKWGISFTPITEGYKLDQPFYHISCVLPHFPLPLGKNLYVPQESLELRRVPDQPPFNPINGSLDIFFERFDGRRYIPNAQHKAQFPQDDAVALSLIEQS